LPKSASDPAATTRSRAPGDETGEVLDVYTGDTLQDAMASAVADLGPDLEVRRARKIRSGVRGLMGRQVYEVLATAPTGGPLGSDSRPLAGDSGGFGADSGDPLQDAVERLLEQADAQESAPPAPQRPGPGDEQGLRPRAVTVTRTPGRRASDRPAADTAVPEPHGRAPAVAGDAAPRPVSAPDGATARRRRTDAPHPDPTVADHALAQQPFPALGRSANGISALGRSANGWSRARLARIGVPAPVLGALPTDEPTDDLGWLTALTAAIAACVPAPAVAGPDHPVVVDGYGLAGALAVLAAGCRGATPGTISCPGRTADATAMELALVVHASLTGR